MSLAEKSVDDLRQQNPNHAFVYRETYSYRDGSVAPSELEQILGSVSACESLATHKRACVVFGRGSQPAGAYRELAQSPGVHVLWHGEFTPWWLRPLALLAAAHGGLIQATDRDQAKPAVLRLANLAMVELYSFRADLLNTVAEHVRQARWRAHIGPLVGVDPGYFCLGVDGDSRESSTGIFAWASYGTGCPDDLKASVA